MNIVWGFFFILFAFFVVVGWDSYKKQLYAHDHYKPLEAAITRSEVKCSHSSSASGSGCSAFIKYAYSFAGRSYTGMRYAFVSYDEAPEKRLKRYPLNAKTTVYVDPENPEMAVLDNSAWSAFDVGLMVGTPFLFIFAVYLFRGRFLRFLRNLLRPDMR